MTERAGEQEYRNALRLAERALAHAEKYMHDGRPQDVASRALVLTARQEAGRVLDIGRDESMESGGT